MYWDTFTASIVAAILLLMLICTCFRLYRTKRITETVHETEPETKTKTKTKFNVALKREIDERHKQMDKGKKIHVGNHKTPNKKFKKLNNIRRLYCLIMNTIVSDFVSSQLFATKNEAVDELKKTSVNDMSSYLDIANLRKFYGGISETFSCEIDEHIKNCFKSLGPADNKLRHNAFDYIYDETVYQDIADLLRDSFGPLQLIVSSESYNYFQNTMFLDKQIKDLESGLGKL